MAGWSGEAVDRGTVVKNHGYSGHENCFKSVLGCVPDDAKHAHFANLSGEFPNQSELLGGHAGLYRARRGLSQERGELGLELVPGVVLIRAEGEGAVSDDSIKLDLGLHV